MPSSCSSQITINFHYGGVFEANPVLYDYGMLKKLENVDLISMDYSQVVSYLETESHSICKGLYFHYGGVFKKCLLFILSVYVYLLCFKGCL